MTYMEQLWENVDALEWLFARGLTEDTVRDAHLGYVGVPEPGHERLQHSIVIPYHDAQGRERGARFRHLRPSPPRKYDQLHGTTAHLYGVALVNEPVVYVTEGEFDSLILRQTGRAAVAVPGATSWKRPWRWLFRNTDLVIIVMDADPAGHKARQKIAGQLSTVTEIATVDLPNGADVTDLYLSDPKRLEELL